MSIFQKPQWMIALIVILLLPLTPSVSPVVQAESVTIAGSLTPAEHPTQAGPLAPVVEELRALIEGDPELFMLITQMFEQVPECSARPAQGSSARYRAPTS